MSLYPFITWYPGNHSIVRGHGLNEDTKYLSGDKPARYPVPAIWQLNPLVCNWVCRKLLHWLWRYK